MKNFGIHTFWWAFGIQSPLTENPTIEQVKSTLKFLKRRRGAYDELDTDSSKSIIKETDAAIAKCEKFIFDHEHKQD